MSRFFSHLKLYPGSSTRLPRNSHKTGCALFLCAWANVCTLAHAQSPAELQHLVFHPAPLITPGVSSTAADPDAAAESGAAEERVDFARFEEVTTDRYLEKLALLDAMDGVYSPEFAETILSVALLYQEQGRHEDALESLARAAGASRIQHGPYSVDQIRLAEHAIMSLEALQRDEELAEKHAALVDLHVRVHGATSPLTAHAMLRAARWQIGNMTVDSLQAGRAALQNAQILLVDALRILIENEAWTDPAAFELEQVLIRSYFMDACAQRLVQKPLSCMATAASSRSLMHAADGRLVLPEQYSNGEQAYRRMIGYLKKDPDASAAAIARVMAGLADWHLMFDQHEKAASQYRQLEKLLSLAGVAPAEAAAMAWPGMPVELPAFMARTAADTVSGISATASGYIDVDFEIGRTGSVSGLDVIGTSPGTSAAVVDQLVSVLRSSRFRPGSGSWAESGIRYYFTY